MSEKAPAPLAVTLKLGDAEHEVELTWRLYRRVCERVGDVYAILFRFEAAGRDAGAFDSLTGIKVLHVALTEAGEKLSLDDVGELAFAHGMTDACSQAAILLARLVEATEGDDPLAATPPATPNRRARRAAKARAKAPPTS